jgi:hypothetical protein
MPGSVMHWRRSWSYCGPTSGRPRCSWSADARPTATRQGRRASGLRTARFRQSASSRYGVDAAKEGASLGRPQPGFKQPAYRRCPASTRPKASYADIGITCRGTGSPRRPSRAEGMCNLSTLRAPIHALRPLAFFACSSWWSPVVDRMPNRNKTTSFADDRTWHLVAPDPPFRGLWDADQPSTADRIIAPHSRS